MRSLHPARQKRAARSWPAGSTEIYWDLFSLRYKLGQPLSSIFTPEAQAHYNRLSKLLWRLRRAERSLNDAWRTLKVRPTQRPARNRRQNVSGGIT